MIRVGCRQVHDELLVARAGHQIKITPRPSKGLPLSDLAFVHPVGLQSERGVVQEVISLPRSASGRGTRPGSHGI